MTMAGKRAAFFFGSGISKLSKVPMADELTTKVLESAWKPHTNWRFYPCRPEDGLESLGIAKRAQQFLRIIKQPIDVHLRARAMRESNYEDLYSAVLQVVQDETGEIPNPLVAQSVEWLKAATAHLYANEHSHLGDNRFASLADRAADLIQWVVYHSLCQASKPAGLGAINDVAKATDELDIFSLNHDLLIEAQLHSSGVEFADGFSEKSGDVHVFDWSWKGIGKGVRIIKLHGSINWYLFRFTDAHEGCDRFAKTNLNPFDCRDGDGVLLSPADVKPMFLTGTAVKEQAYGTGLFGEMFTQFRTLLSKHRTLICCGYGWGDKGINIRLNQWLGNAREHRVVILHSDPEEELWKKSFWRGWRWETYSETGKLIIVPKWLSDCTLADLEPYFDN